VRWFGEPVKKRAGLGPRAPQSDGEGAISVRGLRVAGWAFDFGSVRGEPVGRPAEGPEPDLEAIDRRMKKHAPG